MPASELSRCLTPSTSAPGVGLKPRLIPSRQGRLLSGASSWGWPVPTSPSLSRKGRCPDPHCCLALGPGRGSSRSRVHFTLEGRSGRVRTGMRPGEGSSVPPGRLGPVLRLAPCPRAAHGLTEGGPLLPPKRGVGCEGRRGRGRGEGTGRVGPSLDPSGGPAGGKVLAQGRSRQGGRAQPGSGRTRHKMRGRLGPGDTGSICWGKTESCPQCCGQSGKTFRGRVTAVRQL